MQLVSACLLGIECKYNSKTNTNRKVLNLYKNKELVPVCPEQLGGLPTPREAAEIQSGSGEKVLFGPCKVKTEKGKDVTTSFIKGAKQALMLAKICGIKQAILKQRSPSCGCGQIYDGSFSGKIVEGYGVTAALLKKEGINVITGEDL